MAFLYQRERSLFWWVRWRDENGKKHQESTGFKVGVGSERRRAEALCAQKTLEEKKANVAAPTTGQWDIWVVPFIEAQSVQARTVERYLSAWRTVRLFLIEKGIKTPRFVTYQICAEYLPWREKSDVKAGKYNAGTNTAILEMKMFRWLLKEAVKRQYCTGNPARAMLH